MIWLDNHNLDADWCCSDTDCNGLWFNERFSADDWIGMWEAMSARYSDVPAVVGAGLKNEPRKICNGEAFSEGRTCSVAFQTAEADSNGCVEAQWSTGPEHLRYRDAMERAGRAVLRVNPKLLVSVCGLNYCTDLTAAVISPLNLPSSNLVYEAHEYPWFHESCELQGDSPRHQCNLDDSWGYLVRDNLAPVLVSEFGMSHHWNESDHKAKWFESTASYLRQRDLDWAYWQLASVQAAGTTREEGDTETFGILNRCWTGPADEFHFQALQPLMADPGLEATTSRSGSCDAKSSQSISRPGACAASSGTIGGRFYVPLSFLLVALRFSTRMW
jgi:endoglucanase